MTLPLYWLYLWQLKEYRLDRLSVYLKSLPSSSLLKEFLWGKLRWPKPTPKILFLFLLIQLLDFLYLFSIFRLTEFGINWILGIIFLWLLQPVIVSISVMFLQIPTFLVKQILVLLAGRKIRSLPHLTVVGITGSYGKTSTKEFLSTILAEKFKVLKTPRSVNTNIGTAITILRLLNKKHEIFIVEMGAYKHGEIKKICQMVKPKIGIVTGINQQHLALFGSLGNILKAKYELIESLPPDGLAIFDADNKHCLKLAQKTSISSKLYSIKSKADVWAKDVEQTPNALKFTTRRVVNSRIENQKFQAILLGKQNVSNLLAAVTAALKLGMPLLATAQAVDKIKAPEGTMKLIQGINGSIIIDDSFSSNPNGFFSALEVLKNYPAQNKIVVTPGIIELGKESSFIHQKIGDQLAQSSHLAIITSHLSFSNLKKGHTQAKNPKGKLILEENPQKVVEVIKPKLNKEAAVLLEGRIPKLILDQFTRNKILIMY